MLYICRLNPDSCKRLSTTQLLYHIHIHPANLVLSRTFAQSTCAPSCCTRTTASVAGEKGEDAGAFIQERQIENHMSKPPPASVHHDGIVGMDGRVLVILPNQGRKDVDLLRAPIEHAREQPFSELKVTKEGRCSRRAERTPRLRRRLSGQPRSFVACRSSLAGPQYGKDYRGLRKTPDAPVSPQAVPALSVWRGTVKALPS